MHIKTRRYAEFNILESFLLIKYLILAQVLGELFSCDVYDHIINVLAHYQY